MGQLWIQQEAGLGIRIHIGNFARFLIIKTSKLWMKKTKN